jgi:uncharacterized protein YicC (UPF0701 family)
MRAREGGLLKADLGARKRTLVTLTEAVVAAAEAGRVQLEARLLERARELSASLPIDQSSLAQEVVRARLYISEETCARAHLNTGTRSPRTNAVALDFLRGDEPRDHHHRRQGRRPAGVGTST